MLSSGSSKRLNSRFRIFALYSSRNDAKQTRAETLLFFKYIILVQSYRYIHRIINNIYKNIKRNIYDYKIKRELFTLNICTKLWMIAGGVMGGGGANMLSTVTATRRQPVDQRNRWEDERQAFCGLAPFKPSIYWNRTLGRCAVHKFTHQLLFPVTSGGFKDAPHFRKEKLLTFCPHQVHHCCSKLRMRSL